MKKCAERRWMSRLVRWPRGRYNGRRITGIEVRLVWRCDMFDWLPTAKWNYSEPFFIWLGFQIRIARTFHYSDR